MSTQLKALCVTREKHPTFRVDLTELFSRGLTERGYKIDWHMQTFEASRSETIVLNDSERVFVGSASLGGGFINKIKNHMAALIHDLKISKIIKDHSYDFVQVRDKPFAALVGLIAARRYKVPFFYWMSFPYPEADVFRSQDKEIDVSLYLKFFYRIRGAITSCLLYKIILPRADHVFVQSDRMLKDVMNSGIDAEKMTPVPMGISLYQLANLQLPDITDDVINGRLPLIYVGTMVRVRRIDFLIEMIKFVRQSIPEVILLLVGSAPEKDMVFLRQQVERHGMEEHVFFTGFVPMEKAWAYIKKSKVCLSPFRPSPILDSTTPTKVVEYLAMGRPVVANTHPDQSKVLNESQAGYAVDYTPQAFAEASIKILRDPGLAIKMGESGVAYIKEHRSYEAISDDLNKKYRELLAQANKKHSVKVG